MHHGTENYCEEGNNFFFLNMHDRFFRWFGDFLKEGKVFLPVFFYLKKLFFANF